VRRKDYVNYSPTILFITAVAKIINLNGVQTQARSH
jgi:hypothetical protein